jgi:hypothetical protein
MKKYKNINEEIKRIKSLFTEERLYGNLINEKKILKEQLIQILKKLLGSTKTLKFHSKFNDVLGNVKNINGLTDDVLKNLEKLIKGSGEIAIDQIDYLIKYTKSVRDKKIIDIFEVNGDRYLFEVFPNAIRNNIIIDFFNNLPDGPFKTENLKKLKDYFDDLNTPIDKLPDELQTLFNKYLPKVKVPTYDTFLNTLLKELKTKDGDIFRVDINNIKDRKLKKILKSYNGKLITTLPEEELKKVIVKGLEDLFSNKVPKHNKKSFLSSFNVEKWYPWQLRETLDFILPAHILGRLFFDTIKKEKHYVKQGIELFGKTFIAIFVADPVLTSLYVTGKPNVLIGTDIIIKNVYTPILKAGGRLVKNQFCEYVEEKSDKYNCDTFTTILSDNIVEYIIMNKLEICNELNSEDGKTYEEMIPSIIEKQKGTIKKEIENKIPVILDLFNEKIKNTVGDVDVLDEYILKPLIKEITEDKDLILDVNNAFAKINANCIQNQIEIDEEYGEY